MIETVICYGMRSVEKKSRLSRKFTKQNNRDACHTQRKSDQKLMNVGDAIDRHKIHNSFSRNTFLIATYFLMYCHTVDIQPLCSFTHFIFTSIHFILRHDITFRRLNSDLIYSRDFSIS